ncbi:MAG TPA: hypothetical protein VKS25_13330 [Solirubrobacteraceae bacterium]|nr:hypothetical protein [Solirubrobacteraceae bacterium]
MAVFTVAAVIAVLLAYGVNSTNDAANGHTLPSVAQHAALAAPTAARQPG